jgi:hypothetical protein
MSKLKFAISMSLDGFIAGPNQSVNDPLGVGGMRLHEWAIPLKAFRKIHGEEGGEVNESNPVLEERFANVGATIMGRNMFGGYPGPWSEGSHGTVGGVPIHRSIILFLSLLTMSARRLNLKVGQHFLLLQRESRMRWRKREEPQAVKIFTSAVEQMWRDNFWLKISWRKWKSIWCQFF